MQLPSSFIPASAVTISAPVETSVPTPIYSNVLSHTIVANPTPPPVLPRVEFPLSFHSFTITLTELALIPDPEELAPALSVPSSPIQHPVAPATLSPIHGTFSYFYFYLSVF